MTAINKIDPYPEGDNEYTSGMGTLRLVGEAYYLIKGVYSDVGDILQVAEHVYLGRRDNPERRTNLVRVPLDILIPCRLYGSNSNIRGVYLNGVCIFYEPVEEEGTIPSAHTHYVLGLLRQWDRGACIHTVAVTSGAGPEYEQVVHVLCMEYLRHLVTRKTLPSNMEMVRYRECLSNQEMAPTLRILQPSDVQLGLAWSLATNILLVGPSFLKPGGNNLGEPIDVRKNFPSIREHNLRKAVVDVLNNFGVGALEGRQADVIEALRKAFKE